MHDKFESSTMKCNIISDVNQEKAKIKSEYVNLQDRVIIDLFKATIKSVIPLELKFLEKKVLKLNEVVNYQGLEYFLEKLIKNQIE